MSNKTVQENVIKISGTAAQRPSAANLQVGTVYTATDTQVISEVALILGVKSWITTGGAGELPKYFVSPPGFQPAAQYTTIQSAINAAAADLHTNVHPAVVVVYPGTYTENITLKDGIDVWGLGAFVEQGLGLTVTAGDTTWLPDVIVVGTVTNDSALVSACVRSIAFQSVSTACLTIQGANSPALSFHECLLQNNNGANPVIGGSPSAGARLNLARCQIQSVGVGGSGITFGTVVTTNLFLTSITLQALTGVALSYAGGVHNHASLNISGSIVYTAASGPDNYSDCDQSVSGATSYVNVVAGAVTIIWLRGSRKGSSSTTPYTGTFSLNESDHQGDANSETILSTMSVTTSRTAKRLTASAPAVTPIAGPAVQLADVIALSMAGAGFAVTLPARNTVPGGTIKYFCGSPVTAQVITVTAAGADTIGGIGAPGSIASSGVIASGNSIALVADPNNTTNWLVLSRC